MKTPTLIGLAGLLVAVGLIAWQAWPAPTAQVDKTRQPSAGNATASAQARTWPPLPGEQQAAGGVPAPAASSIDQSRPAVLSLAEAREHGDDRAPPLAHGAGDGREPPTQAELDDPARYQQYSERQERQVYRAYVKAADSMLPQLDKDLARARAEGTISAEEIAKVEEKRRRIAEAQAELAAKLAGS